MTSIDIRAEVTILQQMLIGLRLANIYDMNSKTYMLKFAKPDLKLFLLIESGVRFHTTEFTREKSNIPNSFSLKLRKHIRMKRLESITQLGVDRVLLLTFGSGESTNHLILELYASGNIILTDKDFTILSLLRAYKTEEKDGTDKPEKTEKQMEKQTEKVEPIDGEETTIRVAVGEKYPIHVAKQHDPITRAKLDTIMQSALQAKEPVVPLVVGTETPKVEVTTKTESKKEKNPGQMSLKQLLNTNLDFGPALVEHCILTAGLQPFIKISALVADPKQVDKLYDALVEGEKLLEQASSKIQKGYLTHQAIKEKEKDKDKKVKKEKENKKGKNKEKEPETIEETTEKNKIFYAEFNPILFAQYNNTPNTAFDTFDKAVDIYFSQLESTKLELQQKQAEDSVIKKLEKNSCGSIASY